MTDFFHDYAGELVRRQMNTAPYTAQTAFSVLRALGYGAGQADLAMNRAMTRGSWPLSRCVVRYDGEAGTYEITARRAA